MGITTNLVDAKVHPAFLQFIEICTQINFGQIEKLQIQDGVPVLIETTEGAIILPGAKITKRTKLV